MKIFSKCKDGGPESPVDAYFLVEIKSLLSIAVLKFNKGGRERFHTHAFNAYTWFIRGDMIEEDVDGKTYRYRRSFLPKITKSIKNHRVKANVDSWCVTFRGPWKKSWSEYDEVENLTFILTNGRKILKEFRGIYDK